MPEIIIHSGVVSPMGIIDALDIVEEELGPDLRQYLETFLMEEDIEWSESELLADQKERYMAILDNIVVKVVALEHLLSQKRLNRRKLMEKVSDIRSIAEREVNKGE